MNKPKIYFLTNLWTLPSAVISWLMVLFIWACWGTKLEWLDGLWCELKENSWPMRTWYKDWAGTTFIRGGFYRPGRKGKPEIIDTETESHEHTHIEQGEASCLYGLLVGLVILWISGFSALGGLVGLLVWITAPIMIYLTAGIQALVRGESFYKGNHFEEHAYGSTGKNLTLNEEQAKIFIKALDEEPNEAFISAALEYKNNKK